MAPTATLRPHAAKAGRLGAEKFARAGVDEVSVQAKVPAKALLEAPAAACRPRETELLNSPAATTRKAEGSNRPEDPHVAAAPAGSLCNPLRAEAPDPETAGEEVVEAARGAVAPAAAPEPAAKLLYRQSSLPLGPEPIAPDAAPAAGDAAAAAEAAEASQRPEAKTKAPCESATAPAAGPDPEASNKAPATTAATEA